MGEQERRARLRQLAEDGLVPGKVTEREAAGEMAWRFLEMVVRPGLRLAAAEIQESMPRHVAKVSTVPLGDGKSGEDEVAVRLAVMEESPWGRGTSHGYHLDIVVRVEGAGYVVTAADQLRRSVESPRTPDHVAQIAVERYIALIETRRLVSMRKPKAIL